MAGTYDAYSLLKTTTSNSYAHGGEAQEHCGLEEGASWTEDGHFRL